MFSDASLLQIWLLELLCSPFLSKSVNYWYMVNYWYFHLNRFNR